MTRLPGTVQTIDRQFYRTVLGHIQNMLQRGILDADSTHHERNPKILTIAASVQNESACKQPFEDAEQRSVLREALERVLRRQSNQDRIVQPRISWRTAMVRVRDRLKLTCPQQFPQIEGDDLRFIFSLSRAGLSGALLLEVIGDKVILHGGEIHGLKKRRH
ncbi:hypothetical protein LY78DRAFT_231238 [Colletotrichum sublineola]|nr:hypothetical protein LY78DRAFT_231238 [Colletotrichum sublineola]